MEDHAHHTNRKARHDRGHVPEDGAMSELVAEDHDRRTDQCRDRVEALFEYTGNSIEHNVAHRSPSHGGHRSEQRCGDWCGQIVQSDVGSDDTEQCQPDGVEGFDRRLPPAQWDPCQEGHDPGQRHGSNHSPVAQTCRPDTEQHIAQDSSSHAHRGRQHQHAEEVESRSHASEPT